MPRKGPHRYGAYERAHKGDTAERMAARRYMEKKLGRDLPSDVHVDHKKEIKLGGGNTPGNLRLRSERSNTADKSWRRGR
jgi:hypothetical protein